MKVIRGNTERVLTCANSTGMDEAKKLMHFINFLPNKALSWATAIWQGENDIPNYDQFVSLFQCVFDHSPDGKEVSDKLLSLRQGSRHATEYSLDFRTLTAESGWNNIALRAVYINKELMKELACQKEATSLDKLISVSIKLDNILRD